MDLFRCPDDADRQHELARGGGTRSNLWLFTATACFRSQRPAAQRLALQAALQTASPVSMDRLRALEGLATYWEAAHSAAACKSESEMCRQVSLECLRSWLEVWPVRVQERSRRVRCCGIGHPDAVAVRMARLFMQGRQFDAARAILGRVPSPGLLRAEVEERDEFQAACEAEMLRRELDGEPQVLSEALLRSPVAMWTLASCLWRSSENFLDGQTRTVQLPR